MVQNKKWYRKIYLYQTVGKLEELSLGLEKGIVEKLFGLIMVQFNYV